MPAVCELLPPPREPMSPSPASFQAATTPHCTVSVYRLPPALRFVTVAGQKAPSSFPSWLFTLNLSQPRCATEACRRESPRILYRAHFEGRRDVLGRGLVPVFHVEGQGMMPTRSTYWRKQCPAIPSLQVLSCCGSSVRAASLEDDGRPQSPNASSSQQPEKLHSRSTPPSMIAARIASTYLRAWIPRNAPCWTWTRPRFRCTPRTSSPSTKMRFGVG